MCDRACPMRVRCMARAPGLHASALTAPRRAPAQEIRARRQEQLARLEVIQQRVARGEEPSGDEDGEDEAEGEDEEGDDEEEHCVARQRSGRGGARWRRETRLAAVGRQQSQGGELARLRIHLRVPALDALSAEQPQRLRDLQGHDLHGAHGAGDGDMMR